MPSSLFLLNAVKLWKSFPCNNDYDKALDMATLKFLCKAHVFSCDFYRRIFLLTEKRFGGRLWDEHKVGAITPT